jgi:hypothetical protein
VPRSTLSVMQQTESGPSILSRVVALLVLLVAGWLILKLAIGFVAWLATVVVAIVAIAAVIWAVRVLL